MRQLKEDKCTPRHGLSVQCKTLALDNYGVHGLRHFFEWILVWKSARRGMIDCWICAGNLLGDVNMFHGLSRLHLTLRKTWSLRFL